MRIHRILQEEKSALQNALCRGESALPGLSSFYDPIVRPAAVVSRRSGLTAEEIDLVMKDLRHAEKVLTEAVESWSESLPQ